MFNNLTSVVFTALNKFRLDSAINAEDITFFLYIQSEIYLMLHSGKGYTQKDISILLIQKVRSISHGRVSV